MGHDASPRRQRHRHWMRGSLADAPPPIPPPRPAECLSRSQVLLRDIVGAVDEAAANKSGRPCGAMIQPGTMAYKCLVQRTSRPLMPLFASAPLPPMQCGLQADEESTAGQSRVFRGGDRREEGSAHRDVDATDFAWEISVSLWRRSVDLIRPASCARHASRTRRVSDTPSASCAGLRWHFPPFHGFPLWESSIRLNRLDRKKRRNPVYPVTFLLPPHRMPLHCGFDSLPHFLTHLPLSLFPSINLPLSLLAVFAPIFTSAAGGVHATAVTRTRGSQSRSARRIPRAHCRRARLSQRGAWRPGPMFERYLQRRARPL